MIVALLTASGSGTRMHQDIPKQFLHIENKPVIIHTLERFQNHPQVDAIIVVTLPTWIDFVWAYAKQFNITKLKWVVPGGATGQESICNGLEAIAGECKASDVVMIHDGNRPLVDRDIISNSIATFNQHGCAVASIPCTEAVFVSDDRISSTKTIPREQLQRTQTPHTYTLGKLQWAYEQAKLHNIKNTTAVCTLMCELGEKIFFSQGNEKNIKLTETEDLDIFSSLLRNERSDWLK